MKERSFPEPEEGKRKEFLEMKDLALARLGEERGRLIIGWAGGLRSREPIKATQVGRFGKVLR